MKIETSDLSKILLVFFFFFCDILDIDKIGEVFMKEKIKKIVLGYLPGFITGLIVCGGVSVIAMTYFPSNQTTYDNSASGMAATDVQGAIDELYNTCFPPKTGGDTILDNTDIVTSGDGLYEDEYEEGKYTYKGANPNNYVTFNNETAGWRIISINSDGTIKIMRDEDINPSNNLAWDSSNSNNWNRPASLNTYLNSTYYNGLNSTAQSQIVEATYYAGGVTYDNNDIQDQINDEKSTTSNVKVALPTLSEYLRANSNKEQCGTYSLNNDNYMTCKNSDWMYYSSDYWWTLSPRSDGSSHLFYVSSDGYVNSSHAADTDNAVRPAITLSSEVQITGGIGTASDPYILS